MSSPDQTGTDTSVSLSCVTCPSYMKAEDLSGQVSTYNTILNAPSCPRLGKLLGAPNATREWPKIAAATGKDCSHHGEPMPEVRDRTESLVVSLPMPVIGVDPTTKAQNLRSCRECSFFVPAKNIAEETSLTMGLCSRYGRVFSERNAMQEAVNCPSATTAQPGDFTENAVHERMAGVPLLPVLVESMSSGKYLGKNYRPVPVIATTPSNAFEPSTYPTDKPVSQTDTEKGIRAWQKITNDRGNKEIYLPIFDAAYFPEYERALIPVTGSDDSPELYKDHQNLMFKAAVIWHMKETPALHGPAGTGKTQFFMYAAWRMQLPFHRISITGSSELDDLAGHPEFTPEKGTFFVDGRIPKAWSRPCVTVIDEPNVGRPEVWQFIRPMTDNAKQLVLDMDNGRVIGKHEFSFLGMAMNPAYDSRNVGAEVLSDADGSRLMHIWVDFPAPEIERNIILEACKKDNFDPDPSDIGLIMAVAENLRSMARDQTLPITWGIRQQVKVARLMQWFEPLECYRLAAADYLEPEAQQLILDEVNNQMFGT